MAKFEDSSCFTSKVRAFFWKVPTAIFVNPGQCLCKSVKTKNDVTSSKINIFLTKFGQEVCFDIKNGSMSQKFENSKNFPIFPDFPISLENMTFWVISEQISWSGHTYLNLFYIGLQSTTS